jgi:2-oxoglutarate ferredoxin oxidoreductase subunit alpha
VREFVDGSKIIVRAALDAGCNFFAGYPITPATEILLHMMRELPRVGGVAIQGEDEIASIGFCIGAAMTGARVMTATSGPGISLCSENIGLAIMGEAPMVIVDCQRMGPATGGATTVAQGDVQFLRWGTSGGYPVIVLAPADLIDCYRLTRRAFELAERFRTPVFLATDKELVTMNACLDGELLERPDAELRAALHAEQPFAVFDPQRPDEVLPMAQYGGAHLARFMTSSHDERGYLTKDPGKIDRLNRHLAAKIEEHADEIELVKADLQEGAEALLIGYGITARSVQEAALRARKLGRRVSALTIYTLWPVPERAIRQALHGIRKVVVAELNLGQYLREIERLACGKAELVGAQRVDGELLSPHEILQAGGLS